MCSPVGRTVVESSRASIASSSASSSLKPSAPNSLMPLSANGLWLALMTTPAAALCCNTFQATAGVGRTPSRTAVPPTEAMPAASASSSIVPERRVSRPIRISGRGCVAPTWSAVARPTRSASSAVRRSLATPRMPSVPNQARATAREPSASRTAGACGPSSGLPSCARQHGRRGPRNRPSSARGEGLDRPQRVHGQCRGALRRPGH